MIAPFISDADSALKARAADIQLAVFDVDGVLTDGRFLLNETGEESKTFHTQDGFGLRRLMEHGIDVAIITGRSSGAVTHRMQELGIKHVFQGCRDKQEAIAGLISTTKIATSNVAAVGDDIPDLAMFSAAGLNFAVANAVDAIKNAADLQTTRNGGHGAVREIADFLLDCR